MTQSPSLTILPVIPILLVDASLVGVQVALIDAVPGTKSGKQRLLWHQAHPQNMGALTAISRLTQAAFAATSLSMESVVGLAVAVGPGSFTGIKVGLAFATGLQAGASRPLPMLALSTLDAFAVAMATEGGGPVAAFLPATRTHGFVAVATAAGSETAATLMDAEHGVANFYAGLPDQYTSYVIGDWPLLHAEALACGQTLTKTDPAEANRRALEVMAAQAAAAWPRGFKPDAPSPQYRRLSTAEERLKAGPPVRQESQP